MFDYKNRKGDTDMKTMAEVGNEFTLTNDEGKLEYRAEIPEGDYLLVTASTIYGSTASKFDHKNILRSQKRILNFRTYYKSGAKRWYYKAGIDFLFAIPKDKILMVEEKGYSYVKIEIGGTPYCLNVSGGTGKDCWTDWITQGASIGVFKTLKELKSLAENSIIPEGLDLGPVKPMSEDEQKTYEGICAYHDAKSKLKEGDMVFLGSSFSINERKGPFLIVKKPKNKKHFICLTQEENHHFAHEFRAYYKHIDWLKTAKENAII
jgi:hypothetical protein